MSSSVGWLGTLVYVSVLAGAIAALELLRGLGLAPMLAYVTIVPAVAISIALAERAIAFAPRPPGARVDALCFVVNLLVPAAWGAVLTGVSAVLASMWADVTRAWPSALPYLVQVGLAVLLAELGVYWMHRGIHASSRLFRLHAMHHSIAGIYWLNASRFHPLDLLLLHAASVTPMILLGASPEVVVGYGVVSQTGAFLQHANLRTRGGLLTWLFHLPELHRWHHSTERAESDANFGGTLIVWDVVFGTRALPSEREAPERMGLGDAFPEGYLGQLRAPFARSEDP